MMIADSGGGGSSGARGTRLKPKFRWCQILKRIFLFFTLLACEVSSEGIILTALDYDVEISNRLAQIMVRATFENRGRFYSAETLQLLIPEAVYISAFFIETKNKRLTSTIVKKKRRRKGDEFMDSNTIRLSERAARAQKLEIDARLAPKERFTINLEYTYVLRRKRGLYHVILYLPKTKPHNVDLDISIRMMGEMKNVTFLKADGEEKPLKVIKRGTAEIYSPSEKELRLRYKRTIYSTTPFASVTHHNPALRFALHKTPSYQLSFQPAVKPSLYLADPAFVFSFDVQHFTDGGNIQVQNGYFVHFLSPEGLPKLPVHTVFVLDISGSMDESGKLSSLKMAMQTTLQRLKEDDSFEVFVFSTNVKSLGTYTGTQYDIARSSTKIDQLRAYGGTNINDALLDSVYGATIYKKAKGIKQIVFLTDGNRTVGELDSKVIREGVRDINVEKIPIYTLAFGNDADMKFLRQISGENRGFARKIRSTGRPADQFQGFYEEISSPLLKDLSVEYPAEEVLEGSVVQLRQDSFYSGDEVALAGKLNGESTLLTPKIMATGARGRVQLKVSRKDLLKSPPVNTTGIVERIWAYLSVQDLLAAQEVVDDETVRAELRSRALQIALMYNFVTRLTSLVINNPENWTSDPSLGDEGSRMDSHIGLPESVRDEIANGLALVSPEDFAATLPNELQGSISPSQNRRFSFVDNDPHFVVQVAGLALPLCFDLHGQPGDVLSLVRDDVSGLIVNAEVSAAIGRPGATYFTRLFISLKRLNLTITTNSITVNCMMGQSENQVSEIWHDTDVFHHRWKKRFRRRKNINSFRRIRRRRKRTKRHSGHPHHRQRHEYSYTQTESVERSIKRNIGRPGGDEEVGLLDEEDNSDEADDDEETEDDNLEANHSNKRSKSGEVPFESPVIDAYLEKDPDREQIRLRHKQIKIRPNFSDSNLSWDEYRKFITDFQKRGIVNHFLYTYPINNSNNLIIRSSISINPPKRSDTRNNECNKSFSWQHPTQRRYDDVVLTVRGRRRRRRLDVIVNDVNLHVVVTNTRNKNGQTFLGFYIQEQKILSPNTTGVIGQFVYKSVGTIGHFPKLYTHPETQEDRMIPLVVVHLPQNGSRRSRITRVAALVSKRRSLLHRKKVLCLHVKRHGKGLLAKKSIDYVLPTLYS